MKFWPLSTIVHALTPGPYAIEWVHAGSYAPSPAAYHAAVDAVQRVPGIEAPNLVIIESIGAPARRVYTEYPEFDEWLRLERISFMESDSGFTFGMVDALH